MTTPTSPDLPTGETGRMIVVLDRAAAPPGDVLRRFGVQSVHAADVGPNGHLAIPAGGAVVLDALGVAIVENSPEILFEAAADPGTPVMTAEPEVYVHAYTGGNDLEEDEDWAPTWDATQEAARSDGYRDEDADAMAALGWSDTDLATWGLLATQAYPPALRRTPWSGRGIRVAVLDTGIDTSHPDFAGRIELTRSFIVGESAKDGNGHGTHVAGTIGAVRTPAGGKRRFSVAPNSRLLIGKVLSNAGSGTSGGVLEGMNWAIEQGADVISMSLGSDTRVGESYLRYYEAAGKAALDSDSIIIAAAGNNGDNPVGSPANCPSVMAVAAVDGFLRRASFSSIGLNPGGGEVNVSGPGVGVYSSWPVSLGSYRVLNGTSMATPHVAGLAALHAQATGKRGRALWAALTASVAPLAAAEKFVGRGLVLAPTRGPGVAS